MHYRNDMRVLTYDIGGTAIKAGLFDHGELKIVDTFETHAKKGATSVIQNVIRHAQQFCNIEAIGISTCGQVESEHGTIAYANDNMPGYTGMPVASIIESALHVPVHVENDVVCAGLGEYHFGKGKKTDDFLLVTFGTGIGGTLFIGGRPYHGTGPSAGIMIGGMLTSSIIDDDPWKSSYEADASVTALVNQAKTVDPSITNGKDIMEKLNNPLIHSCLNSWQRKVALGICSFIHLYNVPVVILGGGIMEQDVIFDGISEMIHSYLIPGFCGVSIQKASLGNQAGLYGAYSLCERTI